MRLPDMAGEGYADGSVSCVGCRGRYQRPVLLHLHGTVSQLADRPAKANEPHPGVAVKQENARQIVARILTGK